MNLNARITLAIRNFFKKHGRVILIIVVVWLILFLTNLYLKYRPAKIELQSSYEPDTPVIDEGDGVPKKLVNDINTTIDNYFNYCNNKDYENAFNMLTTDCQERLYNNDVNQFKNYVDIIFNKYKIYNVQNFSNVNETYIYNIRILDDISATGATGQYDTYEEKIVIHYDNGEFKVSNQGYIGKMELNKETESDEMKVKVIKKEMSYSREEYTLEIRNKTDSYMMISDDIGVNQIMLNLGAQARQALNITNFHIILFPGEIRTITLLFNKYYDDEVDPLAINFNSVRLMPRVSNTSGDEGNDITRTFSFNIPLK